MQNRKEIVKMLVLQNSTIWHLSNLPCICLSSPATKMLGFCAIQSMQCHLIFVMYNLHFGNKFIFLTVYLSTVFCTKSVRIDTFQSLQTNVKNTISKSKFYWAHGSYFWVVVILVQARQESKEPCRFEPI